MVEMLTEQAFQSSIESVATAPTTTGISSSISVNLVVAVSIVAAVVVSLAWLFGRKKSSS